MSEASVVAGGVDCRDLLGPGGGPEPGDSGCLGAHDCSDCLFPCSPTPSIDFFPFNPHRLLMLIEIGFLG